MYESDDEITTENDSNMLVSFLWANAVFDRYSVPGL